MAGDAPEIRDPAGDNASDTQRRCLSCEGIIPALADTDLSVGLDAGLGLVSDECGFICSDCTARLIDARKVADQTAPRRK